MPKPIDTLSSQERKEFFDALYFLKIAELEDLAAYLQVPINGPKGEIIDRITHYLTTGTLLPIKPLPEISKAKKNHTYPLKQEALILFGSYKNDAKTREFFKKLIGPHFHFTSFGIDWINERWKDGNPPTYQEFATMWQAESEKRKKQPVQPKKEWALINFTQRYIADHPYASKQEAMKAWKIARAEKVALVHTLVKKFK